MAREIDPADPRVKVPAAEAARIGTQVLLSDGYTRNEFNTENPYLIEDNDRLMWVIGGFPHGFEQDGNTYHPPFVEIDAITGKVVRILAF